MEQLGRAGHEFLFQVFKALGIVALVDRVAWLQLRPWAREQQIRDNWRS